MRPWGKASFDIRPFGGHFRSERERSLSSGTCARDGSLYGLRAMKFFTTLLIILGLTGVALAASSKFASISHEELQRAISSGKATLLDVNGTESFKEGRIPGAIDYLGNQKKIATLLPKNKDALIVAYCGNEYCPAYLAAATTAKELGYTNVKHYAPGIDGWKKSGAKVEKS